jgi:hypothetical protein
MMSIILVSFIQQSVDYGRRVQGYVEAAHIFERESRTTPDVNLAAITDRTDIRKAVQDGDLETAISRVNDLSPEVSFDLHHVPFLPPHPKVLHADFLIQFVLTSCVFFHY